MRLAWRELIRRPTRFLTVGVALTLIVLLLLVLGGILDALVQSSTGLLKAQSAPLIVYGAGSKGSLDRSRVTGSERDAIAQVPGVHEATGLGLALVAGHVEGRTEPADVAVFGYEAPNRRVPAPPGPGEGFADRSLQDDGVSVGQTIELGTARIPVRVVGWVSGTDYNLQKGLWVDAGHLASHAEREHPRCGRRSGHVPSGARHTRRGNDARATGHADRGGGADRHRPHHLRGDRARAGRVRTGQRLQRDHRRDVRGRRDRRRAVLRAPHDRAGGSPRHLEGDRRLVEDARGRD